MSERQADSLTHGPEFQRQVLRLMMLEASFCARACSYLQEGYFSGDLKWFFVRFKAYQDSFQAPPTNSYIKFEILKMAVPQPYEEERARIVEVAPDSAYVRRELTGFIRANMFIGGYREAAGIYNAGSREDAYSFTYRKLEELRAVDFETERVTRFGDYGSVLDQASTQKERAIPMGIKAIDDAMFGGMMPQTFTLLLGATNAGKSMVSVGMAYAAAMVGKRTFVTIHEDEELPTKLRFLSGFSGIPYNQLLIPRSLQPPEVISTLIVADEFLSEHVVLRFMYGAESTVEAVKDAARLLKREWDYQLFICDYGQCLKTSAFRSMDKKHDLQGYVYSELKQLCLELDIAGAGGAQVNREGSKVNKSGADFLRMTDVGDSYEICRKSSNVITINRSTDDMKCERVVFLLDKVRNGRTPVAVECVSDYTKCRVYNPWIQGVSDGVLDQTEIDVSAGRVQTREAAK